MHTHPPLTSQEGGAINDVPADRYWESCRVDVSYVKVSPSLLILLSLYISRDSLMLSCLSSCSFVFCWLILLYCSVLKVSVSSPYLILLLYYLHILICCTLHRDFLCLFFKLQITSLKFSLSFYAQLPLLLLLLVASVMLRPCTTLWLHSAVVFCPRDSPSKKSGGFLQFYSRASFPTRINPRSPMPVGRFLPLIHQDVLLNESIRT